MIASLDGGATVDGRSGGLGNAADQHLFALLRDLADVILVGSGTVRAEQYGGIRLDPERRARRTRWGRTAAPPPIAVVTGRGLDADLPLFTDTETPADRRSPPGPPPTRIPPTADGADRRGTRGRPARGGARDSPTAACAGSTARAARPCSAP